MMPTLEDDPEFMVCFIQTSMIVIKTVVLDFPGGVVGRNLSANAGDMGLVLVPERFHIQQASKPVFHNY